MRLVDVLIGVLIGVEIPFAIAGVIYLVKVVREELRR